MNVSTMISVVVVVVLLLLFQKVLLLQLFIVHVFHLVFLCFSNLINLRRAGKLSKGFRRHLFQLMYII